MPEYKPRRLGDSFASTTPVRGDAPKISTQDLEPVAEVMTLHRHLAYSGSGGTPAFVSANLLYLAWLQPLSVDYKFDYARVKVATSSANNVGRGAFYSNVGGALVKLASSEIVIATDTGTAILTKPVQFTLDRKTQYLWGSCASSTVPTFAGFGLSDSSPRVTPYYTITVPSAVTNPLPNTLLVANLTKNYITNLSMMGIMPTFFSQNMLNFM
jgi:hypothetical protein